MEQDFFWNSPWRVRRAIEDILHSGLPMTSGQFMLKYVNYLEANQEDMLFNVQGDSTYAKAGAAIVLNGYFGLGYRRIGMLFGCGKTSIQRLIKRYEDEICQGDIAIFMQEGPRQKARAEAEIRRVAVL